MPKVKTLLVVLLVIAFSFTLLGCDLITSRTANTDEVVEMGGQVPEWVLLSHRSIASEENDIDEELTAIEEDEDEETVEAVGGAGESSETEQTTSEVAQAASSGSSGSTQQASSSQQQESSGGSAFDEWVAKIKPGRSEYNHYMQHREQDETPEEFVRRALKAKEEAAKAESQGSMMSNFDDHSPTGQFGF